MAKVIICADDYAQSAAIDAAILTLIERGILTATSCMTLSPRWPESARQLTPQLRTKADLGLHLDFTQFSRSMRVSHPVLVLRSLTGLLSTQKVMANIKQQLDAFEDALHTPPDYIDGHLHVHQLPIIREALLTILQHRYSHLPLSERPWLRISSPPVGSGLKARIIHWLGAEKLKQLAKAAGFRVSPVLLGVYDFQGDAAAYQARWLYWARQLKQLLISEKDLPPVLMCHPARPTQVIDPHDPIAIARMIEWQVMQSADFSAWLSMADIQPVKGLH
ncbi:MULTISPECIES: ChbG/HpnK family deacetylase [unclassified Methylophilus]|uniref:ChbG/HpnK family deacetylase n=1 Tax=unclassified Methylophilus TaxID=2630143 RepID=UPI00037EF92C|nr:MULTISPECIES: ChbG/HpnK family deacetylase [unclassified Methylophilus]